MKFFHIFIVDKFSNKNISCYEFVKISEKYTKNYIQKLIS